MQQAGLRANHSRSGSEERDDGLLDLLRRLEGLLSWMIARLGVADQFLFLSYLIFFIALSHKPTQVESSESDGPDVHTHNSSIDGTLIPHKIPIPRLFASL